MFLAGAELLLEAMPAVLVTRVLVKRTVFLVMICSLLAGSVVFGKSLPDFSLFHIRMSCPAIFQRFPTSFDVLLHLHVLPRSHFTD